MNPPTQNMTVLFIEPPFYRLFKPTYSLDRYPLSLGYLAATVQAETTWQPVVWNADFVADSEMIQVSHMCGEGFQRYQTELINPRDPVWDSAEYLLDELRPAVVGISAKTQTFPAAAVMAERIRRHSPRTLIMLGGPQASLDDEAALSCPHIDLAMRGEGEWTTVKLLEAIQAGQDWRKVAGISYRRDGRVVRNPDRPLIDDLDALPFPHQAAEWVLVDYEDYPRRAFGNVFAIRGCPYNCYYCGSRNIWTRKVRFRSAENVAAELAGLQSMGLKEVHFDDDTFGVTREYIVQLCRAIVRQCPDLAWSCEMHVNLVREDLLRLMKEAGCYRVQVGVESGSDEILRAMRKGFTSEQAREACGIIQRAGLQLHTFFMVGFPQETEETFRQTVEAIEFIRPDRVNYSIFTPYPGTEAWVECCSKGLIDPSADATLIHQRPDQCLSQHISPERFRELAGELEAKIDQLNARHRRRELISLRSAKKAIQLGPVGAVRKFFSVLSGR